MTDTDPQTEAIYRQLLMKRAPAERFLMGVQMCAAARATVLASLPSGLSDLERRVALLHRYYRGDFDDAEIAKVERAFRSADHAMNKIPLP
jgi:hypothetical protein